MKSLFHSAKYLQQIVLLFAVVLLTFSSTAWSFEPEKGQTYFTRYTFMYEKEVHNTTNYWRGMLVPVNSKVKLLSLKKKKMQLELESGQVVTFVNAKKHTQRGMKDIAAELLSPGKVSLSKFSKETASNIKSGRLKKGMTKEQVIMTRGYPPRHRTPSTDLDTWIYWESRFVNRTLIFRDGKLAEGRGL